MNIQKSFTAMGSAGTLYLVATPIGNLEDMTYRAVRVLQEVQWIAAEDTRQTRKLLTHFAIQTRLVSYHEHNKAASGAELLRLLVGGESVALVSDAGMPAISDPGYDLVCAAAAAHISVVPVPGANAALSALVVSALPTDQFLFVGFLPRENKRLLNELEQLRLQRATLICYESPHRIRKTLLTMRQAWGNRKAALVRELTKKYEEIVRGTLEECLEYAESNGTQGEYCLVVQGSTAADEAQAQTAARPWWEPLSITEHVLRYESDGDSRKEAMRRAAADRQCARRDIYNALIGEQAESEKKEPLP